MGSLSRTRPIAVSTLRIGFFLEDQTQVNRPECYRDIGTLLDYEYQVGR